jgi:hypothetical protein
LKHFPDDRHEYESTAPLAYAVMVSASSSPKAVMNMIGVDSERACCLISFAVSKPSRIGIRTSIRITANVSRRTARNASRPESTSITA